MRIYIEVGAQKCIQIQTNWSICTNRMDKKNEWWERRNSLVSLTFYTIGLQHPVQLTSETERTVMLKLSGNCFRRWKRPVNSSFEWLSTITRKKLDVFMKSEIGKFTFDTEIATDTCFVIFYWPHFNETFYFDYNDRFGLVRFTFWMASKLFQ